MTQDQALSTLLFLYRDVLTQTVDVPMDAMRAKKLKPFPTVFPQAEVRLILDAMSGTLWIDARQTIELPPSTATLG